MIPVILSGGSGTRLWPVSRENYPKQFCEFFDQSFLKNTYDRVKPLGRPYVVTLQTMGPMTERALRGADFNKRQLILEPLAKNTATAIALMTRILIREGKGDEVMAVFPADHLITEQDAFLGVMKAAEASARSGQVVTLGIPPRYAATGYGYMEIESDLNTVNDGARPYSVRRFFEKPDSATAEKFLRSKRHFWNAGIFVFQVRKAEELFAAYMPELWNKILSTDEDLSNLKSVYANIIGTSIDYGVMEKLPDIQCIPCELGWSDVGSWDEIARLNEEFSGLNLASQASVISVDSSDNFVYGSAKKLIALCGVNRMTIVDTPDAILILPRGEGQRVKAVVEQLRRQGMPQADGHLSEVRPWGRFDVLADANDHKVKRLVVDPGQQLSYQMHNQRDEHWLVIQGEAEVILEDKPHRLKRGQAFDVRRQERHRIRNPGQEPLVIIEVQLGEYFGEDDIVRFQDDYQRN